MSEQERSDQQQGQSDEQVKDLDVAEEQQDDVTGGAMRIGREEKK